MAREAVLGAAALILILLVAAYAGWQRHGHAGQDKYLEAATADSSLSTNGHSCGVSAKDAGGAGSGFAASSVSNSMISDETMLRCRLLMGLQLSASDPAVALALRDELSLTPDQVEALQSTQEQAQRSVRGILAAQQRAKLDKLSATPGASLKIGHEMMQMMKAMHPLAAGDSEGCASGKGPAGHAGCTMGDAHDKQGAGPMVPKAPGSQPGTLRRDGTQAAAGGVSMAH